MAITKDELRRAVKEFRESCASPNGGTLTQVEFAKLLGVGLSTLQRYEQVTPPPARILWRLIYLAGEGQMWDFRERFREAFREDLGIGKEWRYPKDMKRRPIDWPGSRSKRT